MTLQRFLLPILILCCFGTAYAGSEPPPGNVSAQVQELQQKMLGDEQTMALIMSLLNDAELQALLNDPAVMSAVQSGDLSTLTANPRFMKLMEHQNVKEILKRVGE